MAQNRNHSVLSVPRWTSLFAFQSVYYQHLHAIEDKVCQREETATMSSEYKQESFYKEKRDVCVKKNHQNYVIFILLLV